jgi:hypothetical protein
LDELVEKKVVTWEYLFTKLSPRAKLGSSTAVQISEIKKLTATSQIV